MPAIPIRHQVFISSTFKDLGAERAAVLNMVLGLNHIPAGMELFPASPQTPWDIIQRVIDLSDYYVLVVAGMYGSTDENGISYTEREYDYAHTKGKCIIALIHESPDDLPSKHVERDEAKRHSLEKFTDKVRGRHLVTSWKTADDLAGKVAQALSQAISQSPAAGWVRADGIDNTELLRKNSALHEENERLRNENERLHKSSLPFGTEDVPVPAIADRLDLASAAWFLSVSNQRPAVTANRLQAHLKATAEFLHRVGALEIGDSKTPLVITQIGWSLRDELLKRLAVTKCKDHGVRLRSFPSTLGCSESEATKVAENLVRDELIYRIDSPGGESMQLSPNGRVFAERLARMQR